MDQKDICDYLDEVDILEQCAEEAAELAQACLKLSRKIRGNNPTPKKKQELISSLNEEMADVMISMNAIVNKGIIAHESVDSFMVSKYERWLERLSEHEQYKNLMNEGEIENEN